MIWKWQNVLEERVQLNNMKHDNFVQNIINSFYFVIKVNR